MVLLIAFLTFILVVNCVLLILLVLIQLPKKEAGAGVAFGGGATDALFGAGSGNALTKMTRYAATTFLALALVLTILNTQRRGSSVRNIEAELARRAAGGAVLPAVQPAKTLPGASTNVSGLVALTNAAPATAPAPSTSAPVQLNLTPPAQPTATPGASPAGQQPAQAPAANPPATKTP